MPRPTLHLLLATLFAAILAIAASRPALAQITESQRADLEVWKTVLGSSPGDLSVQRTAARRLLDSGWDESTDVLSRVLGDFRHPELVRIVCGAIRDMDAPPEQLFDALGDRLVAAPPELLGDLADAIGSYPPHVLPRLIDRANKKESPASEKIALVAALSRFTEVEVVDQLINLLEPDVDQTVRAAALAALVSVTGADHGDSMTRWQSWWRNNRIQGRDGLIRRKLRRLERERNEATLRIQTLQRDVTALTGDLLTAVTRNYTLTEPEQRNALLLTLLQNPRVAVRRLGLDLVEQRVLNAEPLPPDLADVIEKMVVDPAPTLRPLAVKRLALVDAGKAAAIVGPLLETADGSEMEAAILTVLGQTPSPAAVPALLERFLRSERPKGTATALLTATLGGLVLPDDLNRIAARLGEQGAANLSAAEAELLAWCPVPMAGETLAVLLQSPDVSADRKTAAARGLMASGLHQKVLVANAANAVVYPFALRAVGKGGGLEALRLILSWPVLDATRFGEEIAQVLSALPPSEWLEADNLLAVHENVDPQRRVNSLSRILTLPQPPAGNGEASLTPALRRAACLRLVELHWRRAEPEAMLTALQAAPPGESEADGETHWRTVALVALERFDTADANRASDWVEALDMVLRHKTTDVERATRIAEAIQSGRATGLTEADRTRLETLISRLATLKPDPGAGG